MAEIKGKIGVLIEDHFDPTEFRRFNEYFPQRGYVVEYMSHLWGQPSIVFSSNPENNTIEEHVTVTTEVNKIDPADYKGIICIGAYAMDRLRYQTTIKKGQPNQAPAVVFLRRAMQIENLKVGTICHGLWPLRRRLPADLRQLDRRLLVPAVRLHRTDREQLRCCSAWPRAPLLLPQLAALIACVFCTVITRPVAARS